MNRDFFQDIILNNDYKELIGKILFCISILIFISMTFSPLLKTLVDVDEYFTLGLIKFSFHDLIILTANDVHPPLYYLILKLGCEILNICGIKFSMILVSKIITILPYFFIICIAGTKIKKEYGWLTAGLMVFTLGVMSEFYLKFLTMRMYSWALLFLLISLIYLKDVMNKSDVKSWAILTLSTLCCAYTQYFATLSAMLIYLILICNILFNNNETFNKWFELKKWIISVGCLLVCYLPWILILFKQINFVHEIMWIDPLSIYSLAHVLYYFIAPSYVGNLLKILSIIFLLFLMIVGVHYYWDAEKKENYDYFGAIVLFGTLLILIILSLTYKPVLWDRYLLPAIGLFWFSISIVVGKINNNKILGIILLLILCFSLFGAFYTYNEINDLNEEGINNLKFLDDINNNDSIIIFVDNFGVIQFGNNLNNANIYTNNYSVNTVPIEDLNYTVNITYFNNISELNNDKNIFLVFNKNFDDIGNITEHNGSFTLLLNDKLACSNRMIHMNMSCKIGGNDFYELNFNK